MATVAENLQTLNEAKSAIKMAIEAKGQDMTDVPFTQYAEKINDIQAGGGGDSVSYTVLDLVKDRGGLTERCFYKARSLTYEMLCDIQSKASLTPAESTTTNAFAFCESLTSIPHIDTSGVSLISYMFDGCSSLKTIPALDLSRASSATYLFRNCVALEEVPELKLDGLVGVTGLFYNCKSLRIIRGIDFRNVTSFNVLVNGCESLVECNCKNIKASLVVGSGESYGHLLTVENLIHLIYELRDTGSSKTLTVGSANLKKLANVYVKTIDMTDEMRAEDDLIDEKLPFEVCESTDEGAMLITDYVNEKNWQIA